MAHQWQSKAITWKRGSGKREAHWRRVLADWSRSGLSKVAFCRERGLSPSAFHWWKGELVRRDTERRSCSSGPSRSTADGANARPAFVAVRVAERAVDRAVVSPRAEGGIAGAVEVVLGSGRRVRVNSGFDAEVLARVVGVLEGLPC